MKDVVIISNNTDTMRVSAWDIMGIQADGNYSELILNDGSRHTVCFQLGQIEDMLAEQLGDMKSRFIRIGRGLIVNSDYIFTISTPRQTLSLRSNFGKTVSVEAPKEALRKLKGVIDKSITKGGTV